MLPGVQERLRVFEPHSKVSAGVCESTPPVFSLHKPALLMEVGCQKIWPVQTSIARLGWQGFGVTFGVSIDGVCTYFLQFYRYHTHVG